MHHIVSFRPTFRALGLCGLALPLLPRLTGLFQNVSWPHPNAPLLRIPEQERAFWLTIDDGPARADTDGMLEVLQKYQATASFFLIGRVVEEKPHLARRIVAAGHRVENHSWSHRSATMWAEPAALVREDLLRASHSILCATGVRPAFFRAPAGRWSLPLCKAAHEAGLISAGWSAAGGDGMCCGDLWKAMNRTISQISPGGIVLIHQGGRGGRVAALEYLLHRTHQLGWKTTLPDPAHMI